jgi:2-dehydro-3-deoxyglucarate aldolase/4-hydroxy-2-oxoheptanedioate aldolase
MENAGKFKGKLRSGQFCLGTGISFTDPTVTEELCGLLDFVWIDMEHNALSLETVQAHIMATKGSDTASLVRVPCNDPALIKPVLDIGADGVIVPQVRSAEDVRLAVAACQYPPQGIRGFGPRRPIKYGLLGGPEFCRRANEEIITIVQIEHIDAVNSLDDILAVPGLTAVVLGANDLSGSMGLMGQPRHPEVLRAMETVIRKARRAEVPVGLGTADDPEVMIEWIDKGIQWLQIGVDWWLLMKGASHFVDRLRRHIRATSPTEHGVAAKTEAER